MNLVVRISVLSFTSNVAFFRLYGMKRMEEAIAIPEVMFYPSEMRRKPFFDMLLSSLTTEPIQHVDNSIPDAVSKACSIFITKNIKTKLY